MIRKGAMIFSAMTMAALPAVASAAPSAATAPIASAASLQLPGTARASSQRGHKDHLLGGGGVLIAVLLAAGVATIVAVGVSNDQSSSN